MIQEDIDAKVLAEVLPRAMEELDLKFTFKDGSPSITGTLQHDNIPLDAPEPPAPEEGFLNVYVEADANWAKIDLKNIETAVDTLNPDPDGLVEE